MSTAARLPLCPADRSTGTQCSPAVPDGVGALILDFDGVLADTVGRHEAALRAALRPYGVDLDSGWYGRHVGLSIHDLLAALPGGRSLPHDEIVQRSRGHLLAAMNTITPIPCVVELLGQARRAGMPCAVASGASRLLVDPGLDALGLNEAFAAVVRREDVVHGKPDPELFLTAAHRLGVAPGRCLAVDDAPDGIASARAAGMQVITVVGGHLTPVGEQPAQPVASPRSAEPIR
ncbi:MULTISPECIES: HAD family phosphatase [unclassified Streptomyces]|uniref:HAD family hydrolase n=2 Tax=Streptomyces TaxID=1883 RepID=UPI000ACFACC5|nr:MULTISPECIES: HAD family phosphatase [unclassified Streptomyces]